MARRRGAWGSPGQTEPERPSTPEPGASVLPRRPRLNPIRPPVASGEWLRSETLDGFVPRPRPDQVILGKRRALHRVGRASGEPHQYFRGWWGSPEARPTLCNLSNLTTTLGDARGRTILRLASSRSIK